MFIVLEVMILVCFSREIIDSQLWWLRLVGHAHVLFHSGHRRIIKIVFHGMWISIIMIIRFGDPLILIMGISVTVRRGLYTEAAPRIITPDLNVCSHSQTAKFMGLTSGQPGPCRSQTGPMLAPMNRVIRVVLLAMLITVECRYNAVQYCKILHK